jgi:GTPase SAR1 family protein
MTIIDHLGIGDPGTREPTDSLHVTRLQRAQVADLIARFEPIGERLSMTTRLDNLRTAAHRVLEDTFTVLVVGEFNRGKSTLLNSLLGRRVLPAFSTETTATVCEVHYGETPRTVLFPMDPPGAAPLETTVEDLERYVVVDEFDPERPNGYEKVEVYWPTALCRNGVVLVDSPGLNKSIAHEERTIGYLTSADAIVFVFDAQSAWSRSETEFVRQLPPGIDPFFVVNKINLIDPEEQDRVRRSVTRRLAEVRPSGVRRLSFVDAKRALAAAGQSAEIDLSGVGEFVRNLQRFLATDRAAVKIGGPARELAEAVREARKQIPVRRAQLGTPLHQLEERVDAQRGPLADLIARRAAIVERIDEAGDDFTRRLRRAMRDFIQETAAQVPQWVKTAEVATKLGLNPIQAKRNSDAFAQELGEEIERKVADAYLRWREGQLAVLMDRHIGELGQDLDQSLASFETGLDRVRAGLLPDHMRLPSSHSEEDGSPMVRALSAAGGMLLAGPAGAFVGARLGPTQMLKAAIPQIAMGAAIIAFTPLGWVAAAGAMATMAVIQVVKGVSVLETKLRDIIGAKYAEQLTAGAADQAEKFADAVSAELGKVRNAVADGLAVRIEEVRSQFDSLLDERRRGRDELSAAQAELDAMEAQLDALDDETAELLASFGGVRMEI